MNAESLLLLDLDGVLVYECGPPHLESLEILRLHKALAGCLSSIDVPLVVLTHRSRAEARQILQCVGLDVSRLAGVMAAEDLAIAAISHRNIRRFILGGLRKSLILPLLELKYGVSRCQMAIIDDRVDNLEDLIAGGLGLAIHAPSKAIEQGSTISFAFVEAIDVFRRWRAEPVVGQFVALTPLRLEAEPWRRTGMSTTRKGRHLFNGLRFLSRNLRVLVGRLTRKND